MNPLKYAKSTVFRWRADHAKSAILSRPPDSSIDLDDFMASIRNPDGYYARAFQEFHREYPDELRAHREYFREDDRGFGEEAFHVMWWRLVRRFRPCSFLEIGVYRGQVLSLISLISRMERVDCELVGISPFSPAGDSVSTYLSNLDYHADTLSNFGYFHLPTPELLKAYSTDGEAVARIRRQAWDMIYIDGNHDYEIVRKDWQVCSEAVKPGGLIVLDDSGLSTSYAPPAFATGGHPGPSRLASEIDRNAFEEILQVGHNRVFMKL